MVEKITIAIDGLSSCGKSSFAKTIARELGYLYIDTGAMYRAMTLALIRAGVEDVSTLDAEALQRILSTCQIGFLRAHDGHLEVAINGESVEQSIRGEKVNAMVSQVAAIPAVRDMLVEQQRAIGKNGGVVMDGRDIGLVVFPHAELKILMVADIDVRANRRYAELTAKGQQVTLGQVKQNLEMRDEIDQTRAYNPMRRADDAVLLDNSSMTPAEQMDWFRALLRERMACNSNREAQ